MREFHSNSEEGVWEIIGVDTNFDLGGSHIPPHLGYYQGKYGDVLEYARTMGSFKGWGAQEGYIKKIHVTKIDADFKERRTKIEELKRQREAIDSQISDLTK